MQVDIVRGSGDDEIKNYVSAFEFINLYSCPSFIDLISDHLEACPSWILARNDTGILGALPIVESRSGDLGTVFNSLPYLRK